MDIVLYFGVILDVAIRVPFWLFLDSILSARFTGMHQLLYAFSVAVSDYCPDCTSVHKTHVVVMICCGEFFIHFAVGSWTVLKY